MRIPSLLFAALALAGCASAPVEPGRTFDGWYLDRSEGDEPQALWTLLTGEPAQAGARVHLRQRDGHAPEASLYRDGICQQRETLDDAAWQEDELHLQTSSFDGIPPLAWGRIRRELKLQPEGEALRVDLHESRFGMFLIMVGGAPDRNVVYRFAGVATDIRQDCR